MLYNRIWGAVYLCFGSWHLLNSLLTGEARLDSLLQPIRRQSAAFKWYKHRRRDVALEELVPSQPGDDAI